MMELSGQQMGNQPEDLIASSTSDDQPAATKRRNPSRTREVAEAAFLHKVTRLGFGVVATPWGNSERYDFILDNGQRLWRVQLKCTEVVRARGYDVQPIYSVCGKGKQVYTADDIDALVAHITRLDVWYVLPIESFSPSTSLRFYPTGGCKLPASNTSAKPGAFSAPTPTISRHPSLY
jgi:PD-(D/E)XK nuclease superfamily protein